MNRQTQTKGDTMNTNETNRDDHNSRVLSAKGWASNSPASPLRGCPSTDLLAPEGVTTTPAFSGGRLVAPAGTKLYLKETSRRPGFKGKCEHSYFSVVYATEATE
jgi:hypothetical protein